MRFARLGERVQVLGAHAFRARWAAEDRLRAILWPARRGFESRPLPAARVARLETPAPGGRPRDARAPRMGVVCASEQASAARAAAGFYGIPVTGAPPAAARPVLAAATAEGWPLVALTLGPGAGLPDPAAVSGYLAGGGTILVEVASAAARLPAWLPAPITTAPAGTGACQVVFPGSRPDFAHEFAGVAIEGVDVPFALSPLPGAVPLAWADGGGEPVPVVLEVKRGGGRVVVAAGAPLATPLARAFAPAGALTVLPAMMLVRSLYGTAAWQPVARFANFTIDDPALRPGRLGFDVEEILVAAREHDFHVTVATIPRELGLADPTTVARLARDPARISACYHGNDHAGYEFFLDSGRRLRHRARPRHRQETALREANRRGWEFARRTGLALDRVMVFPHGVGPAWVLDPLRRSGFLATSNFVDRYPLGGEVPAASDLGMRPADVYPEWSGYPLLWRRGLPDQTWVFDLFAGRPVMTFAHPRVAGMLDRFRERAEAVNGAGGGNVAWRGLEEIARHAYLRRRRLDGGWDVRMLANEACLHNDAGEPRAFHVRRPHPPAGTWLAAADAIAEGGGELVVEVGPASRTVVRLEGPGCRPLPRRTGCTIALPGDMPHAGRDVSPPRSQLAR